MGEFTGKKEIIFGIIVYILAAIVIVSGVSIFLWSVKNQKTIGVLSGMGLVAIGFYFGVIVSEDVLDGNVSDEDY